MSKQLLTHNFFESAKRHSSKAALMEKTDNVYRSITYQEMKENVLNMAAFFLSAGFSPLDKVALLSENRSEWPISDLGIISAKLVNVPIYPTLTPEQIAYILNDAGCKAIIVSKPLQYHKILKIQKECPALKYILVMDPDDHYAIEGITVLTYKAALTLGEKALQSEINLVEKTLLTIQEDDLMSIVYTSGTTGSPKGVMLSHKNFVSNAISATKALGFNADKLSLSFLPLSHVLERTVHYVIQYCGATIAYAESIDTLANNLQEIHPNTFVAVPRVFEKIYNRIIQNIEKETPLKKKIFEWSLGIGKAVANLQVEGKTVPLDLKTKHILADKLVFQKIREKTGGQLEFAISGGAPLMKELAEFFYAVGIQIYEGYGLTETSPVICCNRPNKVKFGSVGQALEDVSICIAEDGEILAKGPNIMLGYYKNPQATQEVIDSEGWFHTGDIGDIDANGFLRITDRKKDILIMSNGKNVAPQPIENTLKKSLYIEQAILVGNNKKYMAALIHPDFELLEKACQERGASHNTHTEIAHSKEAHHLMREEINLLLKDFARYEQIKKFVLVEDEMTQENGLLTPTLKYKRRPINERYANEIATLFAEKTS